MAEKQEASKWNLHPIRLQFVHLRRVSFEAHSLPEEMTGDQLAALGAGRWTVNVSGSVQENRALVTASVGCFFAEGQDADTEDALPSGEDKDADTAKAERRPYDFEVEVVAAFTFDPSEISHKEVDDWCRIGSFFILSPYIRHVVAEITRDSGFPEVYLPLLEVPTFRPPVQKPAQEQEP